MATNSSRFIFFGILCSILFVFSQCDRNRYFEEYKAIPGNSWNKNKPLTFEVEITDTVTAYDFYLNIRHSTEYTYSNIFMFLNTYLPKKKFAKDTVEFTLADPTGAWLGKGAGNLRDNQVLLKKNVRFPFPGTYKFELYQAMRVDDLPYVTDAGIRIEKHIKKN